MDSGFCQNVDSTLGGFPLHFPVLEGEQCVVFSTSNILTWVETGSALADEDCACLDIVTVVAFYAETLAVAVASVFTGSLTFFVCHDY